MKSKTPTPALRSWPRLMVEESGTNPKTEVGFLQISSTGERIEVGDTLSREFRLVQCLFSPQNFVTAKYSPVTQTYERVFTAIRMQADKVNERLLNLKSSESEMMLIVQKAMRALERGELGKHLVFVTSGNKLRMEIVGAAVA
jgi:hypothetical protein